MQRKDRPGPGPIPIGETTAPPFVKLPDPDDLFRRRARRFHTLAAASDLAPYLRFLSALCDAQAQAVSAVGAMPSMAALQKRQAVFPPPEQHVPPLDCRTIPHPELFDETVTALIAALDDQAMPDPARAALSRIATAGVVERVALASAPPASAVGKERGLGEYLFVAAAQQVHFARMAATLDVTLLGPVGEGRCPCCGGPPVASLVVGWPGAHGVRFCACSVCQSLWNVVRIKCTRCGSTEKIGYEEIDGGAGLIKAETCGRCDHYLKVLHQHQDADLDPIADDVASLGLDLLLRERGLQRGASNPFLVGY